MPDHDHHDWHSETYVAEWIQRYAKEDPHRLHRFRLMASLIPFPKDEAIVILDVGAGYAPLTKVMLEEFPRPVIAVVHGFVLAGGLEMMMACDLAIAAEDAQIGDQHANYGLFPGGGSTQRLPRLIGQRRAKELMFLGGRITGRQAEAIGLVNKAVPPGDLEREVEQWVRNLVQKSPSGLGYMKACIRRSGEVPLAAGLDLEQSIFLNYARLGDMQEGLRAFREKRTPEFQ